MSRKSLQGGYCSYPDGFCAFEKTDCVNGTDVFSSSRQMQGAAGPHGGFCLTQDSVQETSLGQCEDGTCSPNAASCGHSETLYNTTLASTLCHVKDIEFGSCDSRCSWSPEDCTADETWKCPVKTCTCDKVQIGACVKHGITYCAVSSKGCDSLSTWYNPTDVPTEPVDDCFVCREPTIPPVDDYFNVINDDDNTGSGNGLGASNKNNKKSPSNTPMIVGVTIAVVASFSLVVISAMYLRRKRKASTPSVQEIKHVASADADGQEVSVL